MKISIAPLLAATITALPAAADYGGDHPRRFASLTVENDFIAGQDRHYTNGVQAAFLVDLKDLPAALRRAPPFAWSSDPQFVFAFGQRIFTPANTARPEPEALDRPYAGWIYALAELRVRSGTVVDHFTVNLGTVGPNAGAKQVQNSFHRMLHQQAAQGWNTQIDNEFTWMLSYERAWRAVLRADIGGRSFDVSPRLGATVGNVLTYANAGVVVRYGSALPSDLPTTHISLGPPRDGYRGAAIRGWYGWVGVDARAVGRNLFIDGNRGHDGPDIHRRNTGFDIQGGFAYTWPGARVSIAVVQRSREFSEQETRDRFGQVAIAFAY